MAFDLLAWSLCLFNASRTSVERTSTDNVPRTIRGCGFELLHASERVRRVVPDGFDDPAMIVGEFGGRRVQRQHAD